MLRLSRVAACTALFLGLGAAHAQAEKKLPVAVQEEIAEMMKACRDVGGKPMKSPDLLHIADLTGDGVPDYAVHQGAFNCEGAASLFTGSGGSQLSAYVGTPDGKAVQAFSSGTLGVRLDRQSKPAILQLIVGGPMCGQRVTDNMPRSEYTACWRPVHWNSGHRKLEFAPVSRVEFLK